jgi:hypothetical protein
MTLEVHHGLKTRDIPVTRAQVTDLLNTLYSKLATERERRGLEE